MGRLEKKIGCVPDIIVWQSFDSRTTAYLALVDVNVFLVRIDPKLDVIDRLLPLVTEAILTSACRINHRYYFYV